VVFMQQHTGVCISLSSTMASKSSSMDQRQQQKLKSGLLPIKLGIILIIHTCLQLSAEFIVFDVNR